jgi:hypothetical protein
LLIVPRELLSRGAIVWALAVAPIRIHDITINMAVISFFTISSFDANGPLHQQSFESAASTQDTKAREV